ncbi:MAG TPA: GDP-mannose 4,6-dehydratase [Abditibacterium sp.]|jgi:GDPmannose 4,6-dehydratase
MAKRALITGITGQDGSYLAEFLLERDYLVHGIVRRTSALNTQRIAHLLEDARYANRIFLHHGDMSDGAGLRAVVEEVMPDEIYNLAAQSHVQVSWEQPEYTLEVVGMGTLRMLEIARKIQEKNGHSLRFFQASSADMFGTAPAPQSLQTPIAPLNPYGTAKAYAHWQVTNYRRTYGLFNCCGILFNHESPRRGENFVTRKISLAAARIKLGLQSKLLLGNLDAQRDWGHSRDYVEAMFLTLQQPNPADYIIATGKTHSVREFAHQAFACLGLDYQNHVEIDPRYLRPGDTQCFCGDISQTQTCLGWNPKISFEALVHEMVFADLKQLQK